VTFDSDFKVTVLLKANISKTVHVRDKVSIVIIIIIDAKIKVTLSQ